MGVIIVLALFLMGGGVLFVMFRRLFALQAGIGWWLTFCILLVVGLGIGYRLAFDFEYSISPELRLFGFPIPVCAFHFEDGHWVDFPSPNWFAYPAAFTNVIVVTAIAVLPLLLASLFRHEKPRVPQEATEPPSDRDNLRKSPEVAAETSPGRSASKNWEKKRRHH